MKYCHSKYFYLASYSNHTFINTDQMRQLLYNINTQQIEAQKTNIDVLGIFKANDNGTLDTQSGLKYFPFPQEIVYAHLRNYGLKFVDGNKVQINNETQGRICFVKLYLFEKDIVAPLEKYLRQNQNMQLTAINTKCSGLEVMAPTPICTEETSQSVFYLNKEIMQQIYELYKEYIQNFGPNLNQSQVLLYLYKQFFNIKNENFTPEYS